jgi:hypothetical protein
VIFYNVPQVVFKGKINLQNSLLHGTNFNYSGIATVFEKVDNNQVPLFGGRASMVPVKDFFSFLLSQTLFLGSFPASLLSQLSLSGAG